jgi:flotillin
MSTILFAAFAVARLDPAFYFAVCAVLVCLFLVSLLLLFTKYYKRCPSNRILVIYGKMSGEATCRCLHGGAALVVPLIQDYGFLHLEPRRITISARPLMKSGSTEFRVPQVFNVAIGITEELMNNAAIRLLGLSGQDISRQAEDIVTAELDRLIDSVRSGRVEADPEQFHHELETSLEPKLNELGLTLINFRRE